MSAITPLPTPPSTSDPANFAAEADAFLGALPAFATEMNDYAEALNSFSTSSTSTTSNTIGTGSKAFTVETGKSYLPGMSLTIARTAAPSNRMFTVVDSYNSETGALVVTSQSFGGSGTFTDWTITLGFNGEIAADQLPDKVITPAKLSDDAFSSLRGAATNLIATNNSGTPNSKFDIDADRIVLKDAAGRAFLAGPINLTADITVSGVNGLDTGVEAISTWYYGYVILKGTPIESGSATSTTANKLADSTADFTTAAAKVGDIVKNKTDGTSAYVTAVDSATQLSLSSDIMVSGEQYELYACAALLSASSSSPTLPAGYDYWAMPQGGCAIYNGSGGDFITIYQKNNRVHRAQVSASTAVPGTSYAGIDLSAGIPPNAKSVFGEETFGIGASYSGTTFIAPTASDSLAKSGLISSGSGTAFSFSKGFHINIVEAQTLYAKRSGTAPSTYDMRILGWEI